MCCSRDVGGYLCRWSSITVLDSQGVSASEMTCIVSNGALNSTHSKDVE